MFLQLYKKQYVLYNVTYCMSDYGPVNTQDYDIKILGLVQNIFYTSRNLYFDEYLWKFTVYAHT